MSARLRRCIRTLPLAVLLCAGAGNASASELTAFISGGRPDAAWGGGYGGTLTITLLNLVHGEIELARQNGDAAGTSLTTGSAKAYLGPSLGRLVPYAGLGAGLYHEARPAGGDDGTLGSLFVGLKIKAPLGVLLRAEYQWLDMPTTAPVRLEQRFFVGAGISF